VNATVSRLSLEYLSVAFLKTDRQTWCNTRSQTPRDALRVCCRLILRSRAPRSRFSVTQVLGEEGNSSFLAAHARKFWHDRKGTGHHQDCDSDSEEKEEEENATALDAHEASCKPWIASPN